MEESTKSSSKKFQPFRRLFRKSKQQASKSEVSDVNPSTEQPPVVTTYVAVAKPPVGAPKRQSVDERLNTTKRPYLCRTKFFKGMIANAFELVDQDGSGTIDEKELYSGLLLIHLKLGTYAGPAACKPISREKCHAVFMNMDADGSGHLDRDEFEAVMMVLFGNVMMRVAIQYACTLLIVPMIAQAVLNGIGWLIQYAYHIISTLDEHNALANTIEVTLEHVWTTAIEFWSAQMPRQVDDAVDVVRGWISAIPESVWNTIPLTLLSTILSLMLIPWSLLKIDDFFQRLADNGKGKAKTQ